MAAQGQSSDYLASPLNVVFGSTGPQHDKALKQAFYNTAALVFVLLSGVIAIVVYYVLEAFIRPLLWAVLCGAFLHPFQRTATSAVRQWLKSLDETDTPFAIGFGLIPLRAVNESAELFGKLLKSNARLLLSLVLLFPIAYYLIVFQPFSQIFIVFERAFGVIGLVLEIFQRPLWVWTLVAGYILIVIFWWTPSSSKVLSALSVPIWTLLLIHLASYAGRWKVIIFLILLVLLIVGLYEEWKEKRKIEAKEECQKKEAEGVDGGIVEEESLVQSILVKSLSMVGLGPTQTETENVDGSSQPTPGEADKGPVEDATVENQSEKNKEKAKFIPKHRKKACGKGSKKERIGKSDPYFIGLFWMFLITRLWFHTWILQIVPILVIIFAAKSLFSWLKTSELLSIKWSQLLRQCEQWTFKRKNAIIPGPVRGVYRLMLKGDKKVIRWTDNSMEKLVTILIMLCLIVLTTIAVIFLAFQVQQESVYMASLVNDAVNETLTTHPELFRWLPENTDVKEALDRMVHRAYIYGRKWMVEKLSSVLRGHQTNSTILEKQMISFVDNVYSQWISRNSSQQSSKAPSTNQILNSRRQSFSVDHLKKLFLGNDSFELSAIFSIVKENVDTLKALLESLWSILKGNVNLAFSIVTTVFSTIFFSGTYILNTGLSSVVFLTALFYLLSTSGSQYKVVEWISGVSMGTRFSEYVNIAVRDVFGATLKMAIFYGFYTWMMHSIFGLNIVFIPSALAAVLAAIPFIGTYFAAIPGALELWLVHDEELLALLLIALHFLPTYVVDIAIYSEISGGGHPYLTGLAVAGGMYWFGLEGAIVGPIVLCCLIAAFNIYNGIFTESKDEVQVSFVGARQYDYAQRTPFFRNVRRALSEER